MTPWIEASSAPPRPLRARLSLNGERIIMSGYSPDLLDFYHSLPDARFDKTSRTWSCLLTPVSAWRVVGRMEELPPDDLAQKCMAFTKARIHTEYLRGPDVAAGLGDLPTKTAAWQHQKIAYHFANTLGSCLLWMGMGTGKTLVACSLASQWGCHSVLVLSPLSVMRAWTREFNQHSIHPWRVVVLEKGTVAQRAKEARELLQRADQLEKRLALVVNYDAVWRGEFGKFALGMQWDLVIADEAQRIKAHNSEVSKFCGKLGRRALHRLCLTGTPIGQSKLDVYGQFRFLDPGVFGTSWTWFSNRYAKHGNPTIPQQITGYQNEEELHERISWLTYCCRTEDVLPDLPEKHHIDLRFTLGDKAMKIYRDMQTHLVAELESGEVTAANVLVKMLRLCQCVSGFLQADESEHVEEFDSSKIDALEDLLDGIEPREAVVVFCRFRHDLKRIRELVERMGRSYAELSGDRKDALDDRACLKAGVQVAVVQIQAGGVGVDFTRAHYCVFYSVGWSLSEYDQACARLHRPGQTRAVHYYHLIAERSVDETVYSALVRKREIVDEVLAILNPRKESVE